MVSDFLPPAAERLASADLVPVYADAIGRAFLYAAIPASVPHRLPSWKVRNGNDVARFVGIGRPDDEVTRRALWASWAAGKAFRMARGL